MHAIAHCLLSTLEESALALILLNHFIVIDLLGSLSIVDAEARDLAVTRLLASPLAGLVVLVEERWGVELAALLALEALAVLDEIFVARFDLNSLLKLLTSSLCLFKGTLHLRVSFDKIVNPILLLELALPRRLHW